MQIGTLISILAVTISVLALIFGRKDSNKKYDMDYGLFMGEIRADIKNIKDALEELKTDTKNIDYTIDMKIRDHERRYHDGKEHK